MKPSLLRPPQQACLLFVLVLLAYLPGFSGGWLWDDDQLITLNPLVTEPSGLWQTWFNNTSLDYFPVTTTTFWLEYRLWGEWAPGYHAVNILLHAVNTLLVWRILGRLGVPGAWLAALLWGIHPVTVASVVWVAERKNTLSMLLGCLSVLGWMRFEDSGARRWYAWALVCFVVALLAKTSLVTLPLMLPVLSWWRRGTVSRIDLVRTVPFIAVAFALGLVTIWYQLGHGSGESRGELATVIDLFGRGGVLAGRAVAFYLWKDLWPTRLAMVYGRWTLAPTRPSAYLPTILMIGIIAGLWWARAHQWARGGLFAAMIFVLALLPILGFLPASYMVDHAYVADHWQYLALVAPVALAVAAGERLLSWSSVRWIVASCAVLILGGLSFRHAAIHRTSMDLWMHNVAVSDVWESHVGLSRALANEGKRTEAIRAARKAIACNEKQPLAWVDLGELLVAEGQFGEAASAYTRGFELGGGDTFLHIAGIAASRGGEVTKGEALFASAAVRMPGNARVLIDWGLALDRLNRPTEAALRYRAALGLEPDNVAAINALAFLIATRPGVEGEQSAATTAEALALAKRACQITGDSDAALLDTLATALAAAGEFAAAVETAEKALELAESRGEPALAEEIRGHRDLFRAGLPYRQP